MNLLKLRHAVVLAETGNFARAAERLHLTQPALSRSIQSLEEELGLRLFDRDQSGAAPTAVGRALVEQARPLLWSAGALESEMLALRDGSKGDVHFGVGPFPAASFVPPLLARLAQHYPGLRSNVVVNNAAVLLEDLRAERIEFYMADISVMQPDRTLEIEALAAQAGGIYCRPSHPLAGRRGLRMADLRDSIFASVHLPEAFLARLAAALGLAPGQAVPLSIQCDNVLLLREAAALSDVLLICTHASVRAALEAGNLVALDLADFPVTAVQVGVVRLARRSLSPMARLVLAQLHDMPPLHVDTAQGSGESSP